MKNLLLILSLLACTSLFAQNLSKAEKKALLEEIKELKKSPEKLKELKESIEVREIIIDQQNEEIDDLKKESQKNDLALKEMKDSLTIVKDKIKTLNSSSGNSGVQASNAYNLAPTTTNAPLDHAGNKYRVQIGVFQNFDITHLFDEPKYIVHEYVNGMHRYSIGNFTTEADAEVFKKEMKRMGLKDAFVTTYTDGYRVGDPRPAIVNTVAPLDEPAPVVEEEVIIEKSGFNVKPATKVVTPSYNSIESNPYGDLDGKVISRTPVKVDTKDLNDKINTNTTVKEPVYVAPKETNTTTTTTTKPVTTTTTTAPATSTTPTTTTTTEQKVETTTTITTPKEDVKVEPNSDGFLFRDNTGVKSSGIKINTGK